MSTAFSSVPHWRDDKRWLWPLGLLIPLLPMAGAWLATATGIVAFWFLLPIYAYVLVPTLDALLGEDRSNPPESLVPALEADGYYRAVLIAYVPLQYLGFAWCAVTLVLDAPSLPGAAALVLSAGLIGGGGINVAHELGHKPGWRSGLLAKLALMQTGYGHFYVEHNRGHHVRVATPADPASARFGESYYRFWWRTLTGGLLSAWALERRRLARAALPPWHWRNHLLQGWAMTLLLFGACVLWLGPGVLWFLFLQALIGFSLLEAVNYIEHYGLLRARGRDGRYERVRPCHSWNSNHRMSNLMLYHLQRHSDHHAHGARSYQALRHQPEAPGLPAGYTAMLLLALIPPLWRAVMDPRLMRHYAGDAARTNRG